MTDTLPPRPQRTPAFVKASVAWHAGAALIAAAQPALWPWLLGAVALNHVALTAIGLWPRSTWLGTNLRRLPAAAAARGEFAITIDDGPEPEVTPAVLDILDAHAARATFFCIATRAQAHPALCREIVARGHSVQNHSHRHVHTFSLLGRAGFAREIGAAQQVLATITGSAPRFFRAPAGLRNPLLDGVLQRLGLTLVSWTRRGFDTRRGDAAQVLAALTKDLRAGDIVLLHDGHAARTPAGRPVVLEVLPALLERLQAKRLKAVTLPEAMTPGHRGPHPAAERSAWRALVAEASEPYRAAGRFAWHFARGKLRFDPMFEHLMTSDLLRAGDRVLDIGCGQGLVASLVVAANGTSMRGRWPAGWQPAPRDAQVTGIDIAPREIARARAALGARATFHVDDMRTAPLPASDVVLLLDALHYIAPAEQAALLQRVRDALVPNGRLVMRVSDGDARRRSAIARAVDHGVAFARRGRVVPQSTRSVAAWTHALQSLGFAVEAEAMGAGTPFANVCLLATLSDMAQGEAARSEAAQSEAEPSGAERRAPVADAPNGPDALATSDASDTSTSIERPSTAAMAPATSP